MLFFCYLKRLSFLHCVAFAPFVKSQVSLFLDCSLTYLSVLFRYLAVLITIALQSVFKSGSVSPLTLFFCILLF